MVNELFNEKIVDIVSGSETYRPYEEREIAEVEQNRLFVKTQMETERAEAEAKAEARAALLARLGMTEDEAKLLLP